MLGLKLNIRASHPLQVLCIGAHCDDIEIGCGATLATLQASYPACRVHWAIACSTPVRRKESERGMRLFVRPCARGFLRFGEYPDGQLPGHFSAVKQFLEEIRKQLSPDLIFTTHAHDRHQDHRLMNEITWQTFRDHMVLEYEVPKYDGDLATPNFYVPLDRRSTERKARNIVRLYGSQRDKQWFTEDTFQSLMRLRGIECRSVGGYAEAFHCRKLVLAAVPVPPRGARKG